MPPGSSNGTQWPRAARGQLPTCEVPGNFNLVVAPGGHYQVTRGLDRATSSPRGLDSWSSDRVRWALTAQICSPRPPRLPTAALPQPSPHRQVLSPAPGPSRHLPYCTARVFLRKSSVPAVGFVPSMIYSASLPSPLLSSAATNPRETSSGPPRPPGSDCRSHRKIPRGAGRPLTPATTV